jgi:integrase
MSSLEIRQNKADISYRVRFRMDGKNKAQPFTTEDAAVRWQTLLDAVGPARALAVLEQPIEAATMRTVAQQVAHHIDKLPGISDGTRRRYRGYLKRRIEPDPLGALPLHMATRDDFADWIGRLQSGAHGEPLGAKSVKNHHSVLSDAIRSAVRDGKLPINLAEGIRIETPDEDDLDEMVTLTPAEVGIFVKAVPGHWRPMVAFMFGTGVRWQEASALKVGDVDLARQQARVVRAWKDTGGNGHKLGKPKSKRSRRTIVFEHGTAAAIRPLVEGREPTEFLFTNTRGGPVRRTNFAEQAWEPAVHVLAGDTPEVVKPAKGRSFTVWTPGPGKRPTPHDSRHTYASTQIARGKSMAHIQRQLGHESITTTLNLYTHLATADLHAELGDLKEIEG